MKADKGYKGPRWWEQGDDTPVRSIRPGVDYGAKYRYKVTDEEYEYMQNLRALLPLGTKGRWYLEINGQPPPPVGSVEHLVSVSWYPKNRFQPMKMLFKTDDEVFHVAQEFSHWVGR